MQIIAHRGASWDAPENTPAAIRLAWQQQADAVEVDVRLSADGRLVVVHDTDLRRTARTNRRVADLTLAALRELDVGRWKGDSWSGERIATLEEVIALTPPGKRLFVEIKSGPEVLPSLAEAVRFAEGRCRLVPIGFSFELMRTVRDRFQGLDVLWLVHLERAFFLRTLARATDVIRKAADAGFSGLDLCASRRLNLRLQDAARDAGLDLYAWTVDSPRMARRFADLEFDGITTNRPAFIRQRL